MMLVLCNIDYYLVAMGNSCKKEQDCLKMNSETLFEAITNNDYSVVKLFATTTIKGINYDYLDSRSGETLLTRAVDVGDEAVVQFLLSKGALVGTPNDLGYTPIMKAVINNQSPILKNLLILNNRTNFVLDARSGHGETALMLACSRRNFYLVALLLNAGADAAIENNEGLKAVDYITIFDSDSIDEKLSSLKAIYFLNTLKSK